MTTTLKTELTVDRSFDRKACRHSINNVPYVLHCHHYATLTCQLADDADKEFNGIALLTKASEKTFSITLKAIVEKEQSLDKKIALIEDYYKFMGLGVLKFTKVGPFSLTAELSQSHVDSGWIKKWGKRDKPVNFITHGFLAAASTTLFDGSYKVTEIQSIVSGAESSKFTITLA